MAEPSTSIRPHDPSSGEAMEAQCSENTSLLPNESPQKGQPVPSVHVDANRVLPLALSLSLGMAATAATTVFAYAVIICADPAHCDAEDEKLAYSSAVAVATGIANLLGVLMLGPLQAAVRLNLKTGMFAWIAARAASVSVLWIAGTESAQSLAPREKMSHGNIIDSDMSGQSSIEVWPLPSLVVCSKASPRITCCTTT